MSRIVTTNTKLGPSAALLFSRQSVHEPEPTIDEPKHIQVTRFGLRSVGSFVFPHPSFTFLEVDKYNVPLVASHGPATALSILLYRDDLFSDNITGSLEAGR